MWYNKDADDKGAAKQHLHPEKSNKKVESLC